MTWKFKETNTGVVVEFHTEYDAKVMRDHPEYEEIVEAPVKPKKGTANDEVQG